MDTSAIEKAVRPDQVYLPDLLRGYIHASPIQNCKYKQTVMAFIFDRITESIAGACRRSNECDVEYAIFQATNEANKKGVPYARKQGAIELFQKIAALPVTKNENDIQLAVVKAVNKIGAGMADKEVRPAMMLGQKTMEGWATMCTQQIEKAKKEQAASEESERKLEERRQSLLANVYGCLVPAPRNKPELRA